MKPRLARYEHRAHVSSRVVHIGRTQKRRHYLVHRIDVTAVPSVEIWRSVECRPSRSGDRASGSQLNISDHLKLVYYPTLNGCFLLSCALMIHSTDMINESGKRD
jgi:hypothetical protein